ncbi:MAG: hypothetical protein JWQ98_1763 [Chlorobi bacterium]|nr:hypothetical protein [Chlorobiota bacterium]
MENEPAEKPSGRGLGTIIVLAGLVIGIGLAGLIMRDPATSPGTIDFTLRQRQYQGMVTKILAHNLRPGDRKRFRARGDMLTELAPADTIVSGKGDGMIWAESSMRGILMVVIETADKGHGKEYGYFYSSGPAADGQPSWPAIELGDREWYVDSQLNGNWWSIYNNPAEKHSRN